MAIRRWTRLDASMAAYVSAGPERERNDLGHIRCQEADHLVAIEFVGRPRRAEPLEIARAGEGPRWSVASRRLINGLRASSPALRMQSNPSRIMSNG